MLSVQIKGNPNYAAQVVEVKELVQLDGLDNLVGLQVAGYQALVSKDTQVGDRVVVFVAESQLNTEFCKQLNLYRKAENNADASEVGYLEDNRRVRAIKLRGNVSNALVIPLERFIYFLNTHGERALFSDFKDGLVFDTVSDFQIVTKYQLHPLKEQKAKTAAERAWTRVDTKFLPEHIDTENYFRNSHKLSDDDLVTVTQKLHGTSIRIGHTIVKRKPTLLERIAQRLGVKVSTTDYDYVFGSRRVIKDPNGSEPHFYDNDVWTAAGRRYEGLIPKNIVIYGELVGWASPTKPIQEGYTYQIPQGQSELYVYRIAVVTEDGGLYDLAWNGVKELCAQIGLKSVPEVWSGLHRDFDASVWLDRKYALTGVQGAVSLDKRSACDEGVVVRREGVTPFVLKAKSPKFLEHETRMLDKEVEDIEEVAA